MAKSDPGDIRWERDLNYEEGFVGTGITGYEARLK